jgi:hypothetical protein
MTITPVLVHSPSVGPLTWAPVAERMPGSVVPSLLHVAESGPPFWPAVAGAVADAIGRLPDDTKVVLVAHSNAGLFVPAIVGASGRTISACVFVDAALPARRGPTAVASPANLAFLRDLAGPDGRLPGWTSWWDDAEIAPMFPDAATRRAVEAEQPRLPLAYYEQPVPAPAGWDDRPCGYLLFGPPYDEVAADARGRGWPVEHVAGRHLHQLVDPGAVAAGIRRLSHSA